MSKTLYVRHSGQTLDLSAIADLFTTVGDVEHAKLEAFPESLKATKMGVFEMSTEQQALDCADRFHGHVVNGYSLSVRLQLQSVPIFPFSNLNKKNLIKKKGVRMAAERCKNMNHSRSSVQVRHCPNCGEVVNKDAASRCNEGVHAARRKEGNHFCCDCGKKLRT